MYSLTGQPRPNIFTASSGLDDFDEAMAETARDFADEIRRRVAEEFTTRQDVAGFEVSNEPVNNVCCSRGVVQASRDGVSVNEVTGQELCLTWTHPDSLHWIFEISSVVRPLPVPLPVTSPLPSLLTRRPECWNLLCYWTVLLPISSSWGHG